MIRWIPRSTVFPSSPAGLLRVQRHFSQAASVQRVPVRCGMSGDVYVDLHNIGSAASTTTPLLIYLPPFYATSSVSQPLPLPSFCRGLPTAVVNYRWTGYTPWQEHSELRGPSPPSDVSETHSPWPTPIHDTLKAYSWLLEHLKPPDYTRRSVYVAGSYLGASLAASLALTENHPHLRMAVRGCVTYNGIYNWTMFMPNHPIHLAAKAQSANVLEHTLTTREDPELQELGDNAEALFKTPENMFDHFASPSLFFHSPGLLCPPSFKDMGDHDSTAKAVFTATMHIPSPHPSDPDAFKDDDDGPSIEEIIAKMAALTPLKPPRRTPLMFPPTISTLKIPQALLLHSSPPPMPVQARRSQKNPLQINSFEYQAHELAGFMHKSMKRFELKERTQWDDQIDDLNAEAQRRVQVQDVGLSDEIFEIPDKGQELISSWIEDRMDEHDD